MEIFCERLLNPAHADIEQIRWIYEANFPPAERKPFGDIVSRIRAGAYICLVARPENAPDQIIAFALLMLLPDVALAFLEYVAVQPDLQGRGVGSRLFHAVAAYIRERGLAQGVVWEVEPPLSAEPGEDRNRRLRFYEQLGAGIVSLSTVYAMPNYESGSGGAPLLLMRLPLEKQPGKTEVAAIIREIYEVAYPGWESLRDEILAALEKLV
jgi:GNAT superfamily N-acetyltransferase